jgi:hypothetical protein
MYKMNYNQLEEEVCYCYTCIIIWKQNVFLEKSALLVSMQ